MTNDPSQAENSSLCAVEIETETMQKSKRRLGYVKPRSQPFSESAQKRESVMSLGRIDHLQHRFAKDSGSPRRDQGPDRTDSCAKTSELVTNAHGHSNTKLMQLEEEEDEFCFDFDPAVVPLPPSPTQKSYYRSVSDDVNYSKFRQNLDTQVHGLIHLMNEHEHEDGMSEVSRLNVLSLAKKISDCVKSARAYSARVPTYKSISLSYCVFRENALSVRMNLDAVVQRRGSGGLTQIEIYCIRKWLEDLRQYLDEEEETSDLRSMDWLNDSLWAIREDERHCAFLRFYSPALKSSADTYQHIPPITELTSGVILCSIFNAVVLRSQKPFGLITKYHEDVDIRYRVLENLRYWSTALNYRFGIILNPFDVNEIFAVTDAGVSQLANAVRLFCRVAIQEMINTIAGTENAQGVVELEDVESLAIGSNLKHK